MNRVYRPVEAKHKPSRLFITVSLPVMHTRHTSRNQQCRNTYTSAQDQLCNSVVQYADHRLPTFKCCIFSTTHPDGFIDMTNREMSVELSGLFVCLFVYWRVMQCNGWNVYACCQKHPANNRCHRDGLSLWRKSLSRFIWKLLLNETAPTLPLKWEVIIDWMSLSISRCGFCVTVALFSLYLLKFKADRVRHKWWWVWKKSCPCRG